MTEETELKGMLAVREASDKAIQEKMNTLMYFLIKDACRDSFTEYLEECEISMNEYKEIKKIWLEKLGVIPYI